MGSLLRSIFALLLSAAILLMGHGLQYTLVPLYGVSLGWESTTIGFIGSSYFAGFVLGCLTVPKLVARVGHIRVFTVLVALTTGSMLFIGIADQFELWVIARLLMGWAMAGIYMVMESWLNEKTPSEYRGSILSIYAVITLGAICIGQLLVGFDLGYERLFMLGAALLVLGILPIGLTTSSAPNPIPNIKLSFSRIFSVSQIAMVGAFLGGFISGGFWALGPVVANSNGLEAGQVGLFMAVTLLGGAALQYPLGRMSDNIDRRLVIAGLAVFGLIACLVAMLPLYDHPWFIYLTMFAFGGLVFPLYALCLAHANDNTDLSVMEVGSGVLMMNSLGSVFGPLVVSSLFAYTEQALFIVSAVSFSLLAFWTIFRINFYKADREYYAPFVSVSKTTHEVIEVGIDPEDEELQQAKHAH
ncbi:MFS transporter [uncultured Paraglaciecola sp.]|uniref:MFS transporter n=1 Tax=uncultured Paraglaciecola sp. TaxID=1765024 RepID=UPI0025930B49|nr:MFS transporter [uncultured Paraglaciecola sp.]